VGAVEKLVDYHVHSNNSCDGKSTIFEMCRKAVDIKIAEIGFSEHMDFDPRNHCFGFFNYDKYTSEIENTRETFKGQLIVRKGIEIDYQHCFEDEIERWLKDKEFDFTIGSVHYLNHEFIDRPLIARKNLRELYNIYFDEVEHSVKSGLFDVIGHFDLIGRYIGNRRSELNSFKFWEKTKATLQRIVQSNLYLEINSKGLREECKDTMPGRKLIDEFIKNGGKLVSLGSDAHSTNEIGNGIKEIQNFLAKYHGHEFKALFE
jgi:histidinol-phosphatase (PHP family)